VNEEEGMEQLTTLLSKQDVVIMCAEKSHEECHRTFIAEKIEGHVVVHL